MISISKIGWKPFIRDSPNVLAFLKVFLISSVKRINGWAVAYFCLRPVWKEQWVRFFQGICKVCYAWFFQGFYQYR